MPPRDGHTFFRAHLCSPQVSLPGTNCACLRAVLEFLYTGLFVPSPDLDAMELLVLTNRLCLSRLQALTGEFVCKDAALVAPEPHKRQGGGGQHFLGRGQGLLCMDPY